jgi:hypothetical protein
VLPPSGYGAVTSSSGCGSADPRQSVVKETNGGVWPNSIETSGTGSARQPTNCSSSRHASCGEGSATLLIRAQVGGQATAAIRLAARQGRGAERTRVNRLTSLQLRLSAARLTSSCRHQPKLEQLVPINQLWYLGQSNSAGKKRPRLAPTSRWGNDLIADT